MSLSRSDIHCGSEDMPHAAPLRGQIEILNQPITTWISYYRRYVAVSICLGRSPTSLIHHFVLLKPHLQSGKDGLPLL